MERRPVVLAIDDEVNVLKLISVNLSLDGFQVVTTAESQRALEYLNLYQPDVVLLDIIMPQIDGLKVLRQIRQQSNVPVIILTAINDVRTIEQALVNGADDFLVKPFNFRVLTARMKARMKSVNCYGVGFASS